MRRYFKKNVDQTDLFDLASQLNEIKQLKLTESEPRKISLLGKAELHLMATKKKSALTWVQVSIDSIID